MLLRWYYMYIHIMVNTKLFKHYLFCWHANKPVEVLLDKLKGDKISFREFKFSTEFALLAMWVFFLNGLMLNSDCRSWSDIDLLDNLLTLFFCALKLTISLFPSFRDLCLNRLCGLYSFGLHVSPLLFRFTVPIKTIKNERP